MTMPQMTGDRLAQEIMRIKPGIPVILCSGFTELITKNEALALGIRDFLQKPLVVQALAKTVRKVLDQ
jgi:DNA-binding NtrC family response regulator